MRDGTRTGLVVVTLLLAGCGQEDSGPRCPLRQSLQLRTGEPPVSGTLLSCSPAVESQSVQACPGDRGDPLVPGASASESCGAIAINLRMRGPALFLHTVTLYLYRDDDAIVGAGATIVAPCDDSPCGSATRDAIGGWVAPDRLSASGRNSGTVHLEFGWVTVDGTYDTGAP